MKSVLLNFIAKQKATYTMHKSSISGHWKLIKLEEDNITGLVEVIGSADSLDFAVMGFVCLPIVLTVIVWLLCFTDPCS